MDNLIYALLERYNEELIFDNPELEGLLRDTDKEHTMERVVTEMSIIVDEYVNSLGD